MNKEAAKHMHKAEIKMIAAERLLNDNNFCDAVSRAYYSAYQCLLAFLVNLGITAATTSHRYFWAQAAKEVKKAFPPSTAQYNELVSLLGLLDNDYREARRQADYDSETVKEKKARAICEDVRILLFKLQF